MPGFIPTLIPPYTPPLPDLTNFIPKRRLVSNLALGFPTVVTTTEDHGYTSTLIVSFLFPNVKRIQALQNVAFPITVLSPTTFSVPIDTTNYGPFTVDTNQEPQVLPAAEQNLTLVNATNNAA